MGSGVARKISQVLLKIMMFCTKGMTQSPVIPPLYMIIMTGIGRFT